jgi:hypothetical protein
MSCQSTRPAPALVREQQTIVPLYEFQPYEIDPKPLPRHLYTTRDLEATLINHR